MGQGAELQTQRGVAVPTFPDPKTEALTESVQFRVPAGTIAYFGAQAAGADRPSPAVYLPRNWSAASIGDAGTLTRVGVDAAGETFVFTPNQGFKGKFVVSTAEPGKASGTTTFYETDRTAAKLPPPAEASLPPVPAAKPTPPTPASADRRETRTTVPELALKNVAWQRPAAESSYALQTSFDVAPTNPPRSVNFTVRGHTENRTAVQANLEATAPSSTGWTQLPDSGGSRDERWTQLGGVGAVRRETLTDGTVRYHVAMQPGFTGGLEIQVGPERRTWNFKPSAPESSPAARRPENIGSYTQGTNSQFGCDIGAFLGELNRIRQSAGLQPVQFDHNLAVKASYNSNEQARTGRYGHLWHDNSSAQCAAFCPGNEASVIAAWYNSNHTMNNVPGGHQAILMDPSITSVGISRVGNYWTLNAWPSSVRAEAPAPAMFRRRRW